MTRATALDQDSQRRHAARALAEVTDGASAKFVLPLQTALIDDFLSWQATTVRACLAQSTSLTRWAQAYADEVIEPASLDAHAGRLLAAKRQANELIRKASRRPGR